VVFGILNVTPDSFSDGGLHASAEAAVVHALQMIADGAAVIDIGGESTRPGAAPVTVEEEIARVVPVVRALLDAAPSALISIDTSKSIVARAAMEAGAAIVNDVSAFRIDPSLASVVASTGAGVVLMHSRGGVADMASYTHATYGDVVADVAGELCDVVRVANAAGIAKDRIVLDPGLGFSKRTEHSVALLARLDEITALGYPVLVGPSRKRFVGELSGNGSAAAPLSHRIDGTVAACCLALLKGARLFRVHDVANVVRGLAFAEAVMRA
jgi:dihydropteroate synthase